MNHDDPAIDEDTATAQKAPTWFWVVAIIALIWNLMGLAAFFGQVMMTPEAIAELPAEQQPLYENIPVWVNIAFACAVIGGTLGCVGLLIRKRWALPVLVLSLLGVLVQMSHSFFMTNAVAVLGPTALVMSLLVIVIGVLLIGFARFSISKGWLQ